MTRGVIGVNDDGSLQVRSRLVIPSGDLSMRVTTSGGPGGQHANRSLTRVVVSLRISDSTTLSRADQEILEERFGPVVRSSSSRHRSQTQNRSAALEQMAEKIASVLVRRPARRATTPTKGSKVRRIDEKKARGHLKEQRRRPQDD